jgi:hypothetical protein
MELRVSFESSRGSSRVSQQVRADLPAVCDCPPNWPYPPRRTGSSAAIQEEPSERWTNSEPLSGVIWCASFRDIPAGTVRGYVNSHFRATPVLL